MVRPEDIKNIEPTVSMKLSEYNSLMKYLGVLEGTLPKDYQLALEELVTETIKRIPGADWRTFSRPIELTDLQKILVDHKLKIENIVRGNIKIVSI